MTQSTRIRSATKPDTSLLLSFLGKKADFDRATGAFSGALKTTAAKIGATLFGARPFANALIAEVNGEPGGFALYYFRYSSFAGQPSLWLDDLFVDEGVRSRGVGASLMEWLGRAAVENGCTHLGWTASANNPRGICFYERLGARIVERNDLQVTFRLDC